MAFLSERIIPIVMESAIWCQHPFNIKLNGYIYLPNLLMSVLTIHQPLEMLSFAFPTQKRL